MQINRVLSVAQIKIPLHGDDWSVVLSLTNINEFDNCKAWFSLVTQAQA